MGSKIVNRRCKRGNDDFLLADISKFHTDNDASCMCMNECNENTLTSKLKCRH